MQMNHGPSPSDPMRRLILCLTVAAVVAPVALSRRAFADPPAARPSTRPTRPAATIPEAVDRGVAYLLKSQNADGSWGTGRETRGFEVLSMVPGSLDAFRVATTSLCVMALREAGEREPGNKAIREAHDRGLQHLLDHGDAKRDDGALLYNTWAHIYALQAISIEMQHQGKDKNPRLREAAVFHLKRLGQYETFTGGWNYYDFHVG